MDVISHGKICSSPLCGKTRNAMGNAHPYVDMCEFLHTWLERENVCTYTHARACVHNTYVRTYVRTYIHTCTHAGRHSGFAFKRKPLIMHWRTKRLSNANYKTGWSYMRYTDWITVGTGHAVANTRRQTWLCHCIQIPCSSSSF